MEKRARIRGLACPSPWNSLCRRTPRARARRYRVRRWTSGVATRAESTPTCRAAPPDRISSAGYQVTDASGIARFTTIYPGWYSGRTVHIHVKVRLFDASNNTTTEATTQVFFDDAITDSVYGNVAPYNARTSRNTRNSADDIYGNNTVLLLNLQGDNSSGYAATLSLGVSVGLVSPG
jgi:hypothetical protein